MATIFKRENGTYQVKIRKKGHKPLSKNFDKKAQAQAWAREVEAALDSKTFVDFRKAEKSLVTDLLDTYEEEITPTKKSQRTERAAIANLKKGFEHRVLASVQPDDVAAYAKHRQSEEGGGVGPDTVRRELQILSELYVTARALWQINAVNPVPDARKILEKRRQLAAGVKRSRRLQPGELELLCNTYHKLPTDLSSLIEFAVETAMRRGEMFAMRREHIDWQASTLVIPESKTDHQTGKQGRIIPLSPKAKAILKALPAQIDGRVWLNTDVDSISRGFNRTLKQARTAYEKDCAEKGIEASQTLLIDLRFHDLRHEATSRLFEKGLSLPEVAAITGHEDWESLKRYTHPQADMLAQKLA